MRGNTDETNEEGETRLDFQVETKDKEESSDVDDILSVLSKNGIFLSFKTSKNIK